MHLKVNAFVILEAEITKNLIDLKLSIVVFTIANSKIICNAFMIITKNFHIVFNDITFSEIIIDIDFIVFNTLKVQ